jgi:hypothetical protein
MVRGWTADLRNRSPAPRGRANRELSGPPWRSAGRNVRTGHVAAPPRSAAAESAQEPVDRRARGRRSSTRDPIEPERWMLCLGKAAWGGRAQRIDARVAGDVAVDPLAQTGEGPLEPARQLLEIRPRIDDRAHDVAMRGQHGLERVPRQPLPALVETVVPKVTSQRPDALDDPRLRNRLPRARRPSHRTLHVSAQLRERPPGPVWISHVARPVKVRRHHDRREHRRKGLPQQSPEPTPDPRQAEVEAIASYPRNEMNEHGRAVCTRPRPRPRPGRARVSRPRRRRRSSRAAARRGAGRRARAR